MIRCYDGRIRWDGNMLVYDGRVRWRVTREGKMVG